MGRCVIFMHVFVLYGSCSGHGKKIFKKKQFEILIMVLERPTNWTKMNHVIREKAPSEATAKSE